MSVTTLKIKKVIMPVCDLKSLNTTFRELVKNW